MSEINTRIKTVAAPLRLNSKIVPQKNQFTCSQQLKIKDIQLNNVLKSNRRAPKSTYPCGRFIQSCINDADSSDIQGSLSPRLTKQNTIERQTINQISKKQRSVFQPAKYYFIAEEEDPFKDLDRISKHHADVQTIICNFYFTKGAKKASQEINPHVKINSIIRNASAVELFEKFVQYNAKKAIFIDESFWLQCQILYQELFQDQKYIDEKLFLMIDLNQYLVEKMEMIKGVMLKVKNPFQ